MIDLGAVGSLAFIGTAAFSAGGAGQVRYQQVGAFTFVYGDTNGDGTADFAIQLSGFQALGVDGFVLA